MSATPQYASTPTVGAGIVSIGDKSRTNPTQFATVFTPNVTNNLGGSVQRIVMQALGGNSKASILRLFRWDGATNHLYAEVPVAQLTTNCDTAILPVPGVSSFEMVDTPNLMPIAIPPGWTLRASINDTQVMQEPSLASIAANQTLGGAGNLNLNGASVTAASATAVAAAAAIAANVPMTLTSSPYAMPNNALVSLTSASNLSAANVTIVGRDHSGALVTETIAAPNANTVYSAHSYSEVLAIIPLGTNASTMSVGYSTVAGLAIFPAPAPILIFSGANESAVSFTVTGLNAAGALTTEVIVGPNVGTVTSVNSYRCVFTISTNAAVANNVSVGVPTIIGGIKVQAEGGSY